MEFSTSEFSPRAKALINNGVITVSIHLSQDGTDVYARVAKPLPKLGLRTCDSFEVEEIVDKLKDYRLPHDATAAPFQSSLEKANPVLGRSDLCMSFQEALTTVRANGLDRANRNGLQNQLAVDSLTAVDIERGQRSLRALSARAILVSNKITSGRLVSRIATNDQLMIDGADTLEMWWSKSTSRQKFLLLTTAKKVCGTVNDLDLRCLNGIPCPFRDPQTYLGAHEEKDEVISVARDQDE